MSTSRYAVVRRLSRVLLLPLHTHSNINEHSNARRLQGKDPSLTTDQRLCTKENCLSCCKKFTAFMFSRVGLFFVMIGYVAIGGWLFQALEAGNEQNMRRSMSLELNTTLYKLWAEILRVNSYPYADKKGNFTLYATEELEKFETTVIRQVQQGFDGRTRPDADTDWNYFGAILYAVTLVSTIGYGHITTKTTQGKIATILYSAFGVPLMMLFVANIGSTMAKMFAFVFSRITMIFCCRWKTKRKRNRSKIPIKQIVDDKPKEIIGKSSMKRLKTVNEQIEDNSSIALKDRPAKLRFQTDLSSSTPKTSHVSLASSRIDFALSSTREQAVASPQLPADVRLDMLTGISLPSHRTRSMNSSTTTVGERSKDAITRINELIRQSSLQDVDKRMFAEVEDEFFLSNIDADERCASAEINPIQYYIDETNKLTNNLDVSTEQHIDQVIDDPLSVQEQSKDEKTTNLPRKDSSEKKKKKLKRSKSESTHNRKQPGKTPTMPNENDLVKVPRRRFFSRKLKKQTTVEELSDPIEPNIEQPRKLSQKSLSFNGRTHPLSPPPDYEESTHRTRHSPSPANKSGQEMILSPAALDLTHLDFHEDQHDQLDDVEYDEEEEKMSVPLLVTVFVIPLYLTLGAILFNIWENWGFLNSFYFCFITLTTIGFGDFVPGSALTVSAAKEKLISAALYILIGLVLLAMCFNLMKEQLTQKFKQVAGKWSTRDF